MVDLAALVAGFLLGALGVTAVVAATRRPPVLVAPAPGAAPPAAPTRRRSTSRPAGSAAPPLAPSPPPTAPAAPVAPAPAAPGSPPRGPRRARLDLEDGSAGVELGDEPTTIGRGRDQVLRVDDARVSRAHAVVRPSRQGGWVLVDGGSANGTKLNGTRMPADRAAPLRPGDRIGVGPVTVVYSEPPSGGDGGRDGEGDRRPPAGDDPTRVYG